MWNRTHPLNLSRGKGGRSWRRAMKRGWRREQYACCDLFISGLHAVGVAVRSMFAMSVRGTAARHCCRVERRDDIVRRDIDPLREERRCACARRRTHSATAGNRHESARAMPYGHSLTMCALQTSGARSSTNGSGCSPGDSIGLILEPMPPARRILPNARSTLRDHRCTRHRRR